MSDDAIAALREQVEKLWPGRDREEARGTRQIREVVPGFEVARLAPATPGEPWLYVTLGVSLASPDDPTGLELVLPSPRENPRHVETLSSCGYFHSFYGLDLGKTMRVAHGWFLDSPCDRLVLAFEHAMAEVAGRPVRFVRLVPITRDEETVLRESGLPALLTRLEGIDVLDPLRS